MTIWDNIEHIRRVVENSTTYNEVLSKLGLDYFNNFGKLIRFMKKHNMKLRG